MTMVVSPPTTPRVSICVPNLNTRPFLPERFATIVNQTYRDWELLVYDSYSDDGSWELIVDLQARDPRVRAWQGARQGTPGSWTPCVQAARGDYVYIATSDDTMAPNCLEALVTALDARPGCDLAHCPLLPIDEHGQTVASIAEWWNTESLFAQSSGSLVSQPHLRLAPYDGFLHLLGGTVYVSITQLLIRRSLFDRIGFFRPDWGSIGDFNWGMRAGLVANAVHVPETWGGWRLHRQQATASVDLTSVAHQRAIDAMVDDALAACSELLPPEPRRLAQCWSAEARAMRAYVADVAARRGLSFMQRAVRLGAELWAGSAAAREYARGRLFRDQPADWVRRRLEGAGLRHRVQATPTTVSHLRAAYPALPTS